MLAKAARLPSVRCRALSQKTPRTDPAKAITSLYKDKFCKNCAHFMLDSKAVDFNEAVRLGRCMLYPVVDPVTGDMDYVHARTLRLGVGLDACGPSAKYYELRPDGADALATADMLGPP